jgi:hypothetical protein
MQFLEIIIKLVAISLILRYLYQYIINIYYYILYYNEKYITDYYIDSDLDNIDIITLEEGNLLSIIDLKYN